MALSSGNLESSRKEHLIDSGTSDSYCNLRGKNNGHPGSAALPKDMAHRPPAGKDDEQSADASEKATGIPYERLASGMWRGCTRKIQLHGTVPGHVRFATAGCTNTEEAQVKSAAAHTSPAAVVCGPPSLPPSLSPCAPSVLGGCVPCLFCVGACFVPLWFTHQRHPLNNTPAPTQSHSTPTHSPSQHHRVLCLHAAHVCYCVQQLKRKSESTRSFKEREGLEHHPEGEQATETERHRTEPNRCKSRQKDAEKANSAETRRPAS